jgi:hypothetical protein
MVRIPRWGTLQGSRKAVRLNWMTLEISYGRLTAEQQASADASRSSY